MPNSGIDWDRRKIEIEEMIRTRGVSIALRYHWIERVDVNERTEVLDRLGFLECAKPKVNCHVIHVGDHSAKVTMTEERVLTISRTMSTKIQAEIASKISTSLAGIGAEVSGKIVTEDASAEQIAAAIRSAIASEQSVTLETHADDCKVIEVPYGLAAVVTMKGTLIVYRYFKIDWDTGQIEWQEIKLDTSGLEVDISIDAKAFYEDAKYKDTTCEPCEEKKTGYKVKRGDNMTAIAKRFNTTVKDILKLNPEIKDPDVIKPRQIVRLPMK